MALNQSVQSHAQVYTHVTTHRYTFLASLVSVHLSKVLKNGTWQTRIRIFERHRKWVKKCSRDENVKWIYHERCMNCMRKTWENEQEQERKLVGNKRDCTNKTKDRGKPKDVKWKANKCGLQFVVTVPCVCDHVDVLASVYKECQSMLFEAD